MKTYSLLAYTRRPTSRQEANNDDIAASMHLAIRERADGNWRALNDNYGILFAAAVPVDQAPKSACGAATAGQYIVDREHTDAVNGDAPSDAIAYNALMPGVDLVLKSLVDPYLFRMRDGTFGVAATRTNRGGQPDGSECDSLLLVTSDDLLTYTQWGQLKFKTQGGVHRPAIRFREEEEDYEISWVTDEGEIWHAITDDLIEPTQSGQPLDCARVPLWWHAFFDPDVYDPDRFNIPDCVPGNTISLSVSEMEQLIDRFGHIYNTATWAPRQLIPSEVESEQEAQEALDPLTQVRAKLRYSDDSMTTRAVDWNLDELHELAEELASGSLETGDQWQLSGVIRQEKYPVPFAEGRADPSIFAWEWNGEPMFLFIATDDTDGNCIDPHHGRTHMPLRTASSIYELSDQARAEEQEIDLLTCGDLNSEGRAMTGCFWAPELHVINGRLSILFMPSFDGEPDENGETHTDMWTGRCHIMQLKQDEDGNDLDPRVPENWTVPEPIVRADGGILNPVQQISLDMTVIQDDDHWYYAWQQVGSIWCAPFDPEHPARLTGEPRQIVLPEFAWDNMIAEGPNAIVHDGTIFMLYSGSSVGIDYTTGLAMAPAGVDADLSDPENWTKLDYPLQKSSIYNGSWQLGTGHGMWSYDEDGNLLYVFHAAKYEHGEYRGRYTVVRRAHWSEQGLPVLDMQRHEELDPAFARVVMDITVD